MTMYLLGPKNRIKDKDNVQKVSDSKSSEPSFFMYFFYPLHFVVLYCFCYYFSWLCYSFGFLSDVLVWYSSLINYDKQSYQDKCKQTDSIAQKRIEWTIGWALDPMILLISVSSRDDWTGWQTPNRQHVIDSVSVRQRNKLQTGRNMQIGCEEHRWSAERQ